MMATKLKPIVIALHGVGVWLHHHPVVASVGVLFVAYLWIVSNE